MKSIIWEELTEEELYNAVLVDFTMHVKNNEDFKKWAGNIVENLCLMMSKVTSFITYLDPKNSAKLVFPEKDYNLTSINKKWQKEAKTALIKVWLPN